MNLTHQRNVIFHGLGGFGRGGLREDEKRKCQVDEPIFERLDVSEALSVLVHLSTHAPSDSGCCSSNSGYDSTSNHLSFLLRAFSDPVVSGTQVGGGVDEVNVEIGVIVLLEINRIELCGVDMNVLQLLQSLCKLCVIVRSSFHCQLTCGGYLGLKYRGVVALGTFGQGFKITTLRETEVKCY